MYNHVNADFKSLSDYAKASRELCNIKLKKHLKVSYLSSYTAQTLAPYITVELAKKNISADLYFAPFNHFEEEILNQESGLYQNQPDITILHLRLEESHPDLLTRFFRYSSDEKQAAEDDIISRVRLLLSRIRENLDTQIIMFDFENTLHSTREFNDSPIRKAKSSFVKSLNERMTALVDEINGCYITNYSALFHAHGFNNLVDPKLFFMGRVPFNGKGQIAIGKSLARCISAIVKPPAKCLVLDLDNTLWGGVIGEEGISGIQLGNEYPGNVFKAFQNAILSLRDQGVLLAIASKNNEDDAIEVFEKHTDCPLKITDFSSCQISWEDKASSINKISQELNIGLDSIVFFDDNPVERAWVQKQLPEVTVIDVPTHVVGYIQALEESSSFDRLSLTAEDKKRAVLYVESKKREDALTQSSSMEDFLTGLNMHATIGLMDDVTTQRVEQLINKTNQFNLTTKRYTFADLERITANNGKVFWLSVKDKYGDSGLVAVAILVPHNSNSWLIDSFLMSCRVIGKKIETALLYELIAYAKGQGATDVYGQYYETKKNSITASFFNDHHFTLDGDSRWVINVAENKLSSPQFIKIDLTGALS